MTTSSHPALRIFVSHSHKDNDFGVQIVEDLRYVFGDDATVWYDVLGGLRGGDEFLRVIVEEITKCSVFILVLSPDALKSEWVRREYGVAWNERKNIIPLLYRPCQVWADINIFHLISFLKKTYELAFNELLSTLRLPNEAGILVPFERQIEAAFAAKDWPAVIRKVNLLLKYTPAATTSSIYNMQALALIENGEVRRARKVVDNALSRASNLKQRLTLLSDYAEMLILRKQWREALYYVEEALRLEPKNRYWLAKQKEVQRNIVSKVVREDDQEAIAAYERGKVYEGRKEYRLAITNYDIAIKLNPRYAVAYNDRGLAYYHIGKYQRAIHDFGRAIKLKSDYAIAFYNRGYVHLNRKDHRENRKEDYQLAFLDFDRASQIAPNFSETKVKRDEVYRLLQEQPRQG